LQYILNFHRLTGPSERGKSKADSYSVDRRLFESICDFARNTPEIFLTIDDGFLSDYEIAFPILANAGMKATFFFTADNIGREGYCSPRHLVEMARAGMGIGLHGMFHRNWRGLGPGELLAEHRDARRRIEEIVGKRVDEAACPFGGYDRAVLRSLRTLGFRTVYTSDGGWAKDSKWLQPRNTVHRGETVPEIEDRMSRQRSIPSRLAGSLRTFVKRMR
jgi:peptidoglycan/xylan/chitin deacetylase (PgdA/CDA1 family)